MFLIIFHSHTILIMSNWRAIKKCFVFLLTVLICHTNAWASHSGVAVEIRALVESNSRSMTLMISSLPINADCRAIWNFISFTWLQFLLNRLSSEIDDSSSQQQAFKHPAVIIFHWYDLWRKPANPCFSSGFGNLFIIIIQWPGPPFRPNGEQTSSNNGRKENQQIPHSKRLEKGSSPYQWKQNRRTSIRHHFIRTQIRTKAMLAPSTL